MERLQKALELARAERVRRLLAVAAVPTLAERPAPPLMQDTLVFSHTRVASIEPSVLRANGVMPADASGPAGHAFKMLRTQVLQRLRQRGWNTLAVVSPTPEDGKTFTAINLAIAISGDSNVTSLLVDLDLRKP